MRNPSAVAKMTRRSAVIQAPRSVLRRMPLRMRPVRRQAARYQNLCERNRTARIVRRIIMRMRIQPQFKFNESPSDAPQKCSMRRGAGGNPRFLVSIFGNTSKIASQPRDAGGDATAPGGEKTYCGGRNNQPVRASYMKCCTELLS